MTLFPHTAVLIAACAVLSTATVGAQRVPDIRLDTGSLPGTSLSYYPRIAAAGDSVYAIWQDARSGRWDIYCNASNDRGATWLPTDVRLCRDEPGTANSEWPGIAAAGSAVYAVWQDRRNGGFNILFNRSLDGGQSWLGEETRLNSSPTLSTGTAQSPIIAAAGNAVYVLFTDFQSGQYELYVNRSLDNGSTWLGAPISLGPVSLSLSRSAEIAISGSNVYATWTVRSGGNNSIQFSQSTDNGTTWLPNAIQVDEGLGDAREGSLAAAGSTVYVAWRDDRNALLSGDYDVYLNYSTDGGLTWQTTDRRLNTDAPGTTFKRAPELCASGNAVYAVWEDWRVGAQGCYFTKSTDQGATWLPNELKLDTNSSFTSTPQLAVEGSTVVVSWQDIGTGPRCTRSSDGGTTWLSQEVLMATGAGASEPAGPVITELAISNGNAWVAWQDGRGNQFGAFRDDIYINLPFGGLEYGTATAGSGGFAPRMTAQGTPLLGEVATLEVSDGLGGAAAALLIGGAQVAQPLLGGTLLVTPVFAPPVALTGTPGAAGDGALSLPLTLPSSETFVGLPLYFQVLPLDPGAPQGVAMSNGVELWIG